MIIKVEVFVVPPTTKETLLGSVLASKVFTRPRDDFQEAGFIRHSVF